MPKIGYQKIIQPMIELFSISRILKYDLSKENFLKKYC